MVGVPEVIHIKKIIQKLKKKCLPPFYKTLAIWIKSERGHPVHACPATALKKIGDFRLLLNSENNIDEINKINDVNLVINPLSSPLLFPKF